MIVEEIHNQLHQDKGLDIIYAHHDAHFVLCKRRQLVIHSAECKRSVCSGSNSEFLHS